MTGLNGSRRAFITGAASLPLVAFTGPVRAAAPQKQTSAVTVTRLAWAGIKLQTNDCTLFIDARAPNPANGTPGPVLQSSTSRTFALATHHHGDHCDPNALKAVLGERGYLVLESDVARFVDQRIVPIEPVAMYEPSILSRQIGQYVAWPVPASDGLGSPQVSWVVDANGKRLIHCGDTAWHGDWPNIARAYGPFDVAFLPINGFRQSGGMFGTPAEPMSLTPGQAVEAAKILGARLVVPIHFGSSGDPNYVEESHNLERFVSASSKSGMATRILRPGDSFDT